MDRNRLFSYHQWATLKCLRHVQTLGEELYRREGANSFASIEKTMEHVIGVEKLWLMRMNGVENPSFEHFDMQTTERAIEVFMLVHAELELYMSSLSEQQWQEALKFKNLHGDEFVNTREEMLFTIVNHGTYHRGQVTSFLRQFGKEGIALDYLYFNK